jgi:hypothetical protein
MGNDDIDFESLVHDRYLPYGLLKRSARFEVQGGVIEGVASRVARDIYTKTIGIQIDGRMHTFPEPDIIALHGDGFVFVYGYDGACAAEYDVFDAAENGSAYYGENLDSVLRRTRPTAIRVIHFRYVNGKTE